MTRTVAQLLEEASHLAEKDRVALAELLLETLSVTSNPEIEVLWAEETERRCREIDSGAVTTVPWEEVRAKMYALLDRRRGE
jgi:putative addiction module component (TIGR02574 family)